MKQNRNAPCACGSHKKAKHCCMRTSSGPQAAEPKLSVSMNVIQRSEALAGIIRGCDGCQACCAGALTINDPELVVPRGRACANLNAVGCSIHGPSLPKTCTGFICSYLVEPGDLTPDDTERLAHELLADPVTETFTINQLPFTINQSQFTIETTLLPGVTDPPADNLRHAAELLGMERGKLNIAVVTTANYFAPHLLAKFCQRYKKVTVSLNVSNREAILKQLDDNSIDMAIMGQPPDNLDIVSQSFMENPLVVVAPPDHPLCKKEKITVKRLSQEVFLVREPGSGTRSAMERFFKQHGVRLITGMETDTTEAIKQAVQAGMGLGIMSRHTAELELETGRLRVLDVQGFPIVRYWHIVNRKHKRLSAVAQAFKDFLLGEAEELMQKSKDKQIQR